MSENKPENPNAFPSSDGYTQPEWGMTLRDYFAAKAMQSLLPFKQSRNSAMTQSTVVKESYWIANMMLEEREKYKPEVKPIVDDDLPY